MHLKGNGAITFSNSKANSVLELPLSERPRERLQRFGAEALQAEELIAIVLGSGSQKDPVLKVARELLKRFRCLHHLAEASVEELQEFHGIGLAKALKLKAAFSLGQRCFREIHSHNLVIQSPKKAFEMAMPYISQEQREIFFVLLLSQKMRLIGVEIVSIGTLSATLVHPREVFYQAVRRKASALIAVHNHPSGDLKPSRDDLLATEQLIKVSNVLEIPLLDHLIISNSNYYSMRENGITFNENKKGLSYICE